MQIFETFECFGQNSWSSSFQFWNGKSILFKFWIILHCNDTYLLCKYAARTFSTLDARIPSVSQYWHFQVLLWKFSKFLMSFSKPQVSFSSNIASHFSVMKDNFPVLFYVKGYILCTKGANQNSKFWDFQVLRLKLTKFLSFLQSLHHFSVT